MNSQRSLRDQLTEVAGQFRQRRSFVQPISQVLLDIATENANKTFNKAREQVLAWIAKRAGTDLPQTAWEGKSFTLGEVGSQHTAAIAIDDPFYWTARIDDADKEVAQRTWITEVGLGVANNDLILFGCRLYSVAFGDNPPFSPTVPGLVRQIIKKLPTSMDGRQISEKAWRITSREDVEPFIEFIESPDRNRPIIVISVPDDEKSVLIQPDELSRQTLGVAHVVSISVEASYEMSDQLGKEFSVFNSAVRTYRPRFNASRDEPGSHPVAIAKTIETWNGKGTNAFFEFLVQQCMRNSIYGRDIQAELPSFASAQVMAAKAARLKANKDGQTDAELLTLALEEIEEMKKSQESESQTWEGLLAHTELERDQLREELSTIQSKNRALNTRVTSLMAALEERGAKREVIIPDTLEELEFWAKQYLSGMVYIMNRAYRAAKKSGYSNPKLVYQALLVLRDYYVPMRREGGIERKNAYETALHKMGLEETPSFASGRAGEFGNEYFVDYKGMKREMDHHLKGSNTRDERYGLRIYFFWDDDNKEVVVGSLPAHLTTRAS